MFFINELINTATSIGTYEGLSTEMTTEAVVTQLIDDLEITKAASRLSWATGNLTYTITIDNQSANPYVDPTVTDTIDPLLATLVDGTVTINGTPATTPTDYTFDVGTGLLTVYLEDVVATSTTEIEFEVERV